MQEKSVTRYRILLVAMVTNIVMIRVAAIPRVEMVIWMPEKSVILRLTQLDAKPINIVTRIVDANRCAEMARRKTASNVITIESQPRAARPVITVHQLASVLQNRPQLLLPRQQLRPQQVQQVQGSTHLHQPLRPRQAQRLLLREARLECLPKLRLRDPPRARLECLPNFQRRLQHEDLLQNLRHRRQGFRPLAQQRRPLLRRQVFRRHHRRKAQHKDELIRPSLQRYVSSLVLLLAVQILTFQ